MYDEIKKGNDVSDDSNSLLTGIATSVLTEDAGSLVVTDEGSLRRWGFQYAIKERDTELLTADNLLHEYKTRKKEETDHWQFIYDVVQKRYRDKIETIKDEIKRLEVSKLPEDPTKDELRKQKRELEQEIKDYLQRIIDVRRRMITAKQDMLNKCMDEAAVQLDKAMGLQKKVYEETKKINQQQFIDSKITMDERIVQLTAKRSKFLERQDEVGKRIKLINADGVNPATAYILIGLGTSAATAAGYFFSIFTSTANFSNQDAFFFLLNGFLKAGGNTTIGFLNKMGFLVLFVVAIGILSYLCYLVFEKLFGGKRKLKEDYARFDAYSRILKDNGNITTEIKAGNWFSFWLQVSPIITIAGIVVLLLALNDVNNDAVVRLNSSLEGVLTGTAVALGAGGVMCLYIMKIIEPRLLQRQDEGKTISHWLKHNWELAGCMLIFIVFTISIIFFPLRNGQLDNQSTNSIAIAGFMIVTLLSAFSFAYGLRFRGLIGVNRFLQREIDKIDYVVAILKTPEKAEESSSYKKAEIIVGELLTAIQGKVMLLKEGRDHKAFVHANARDQKKQDSFRKALANIKRNFQNLFTITPSRDTSRAEKLIELAEWEQYCFPDIDEELKLLGAECAEKEKEYKAVVNQLDKLESEYSSHAEEVEGKSKKLQKDIETLLTYIEKSETSKLNRFTRLNEFSMQAESAILDGFHLGIWYREHQMGPANDYYLPFTKNIENGK